MIGIPLLLLVNMNWLPRLNKNKSGSTWKPHLRSQTNSITFANDKSPVFHFGALLVFDFHF